MENNVFIGDIEAVNTLWSCQVHSLGYIASREGEKGAVQGLWENSFYDLMERKQFDKGRYYCVSEGRQNHSPTFSILHQL